MIRDEIFSQNGIGQPAPIGRHAVLRIDRADRAGFVVRALVAHHADRSHGQQHAKRLPERVIKARRADFFVDDSVGFSQALQACVGHFAKTSNRKTRPWEGLPAC